MEKIPKSNEKNILATTCYGHFLSHYNMLAFPALVIPLSKQMSIGIPQVLEISFFMYLLFGITALFWGIAADKIGSRPLFFIFFIGAGISGLLAAFSTDSIIKLTLCLASIGIFSGIHHPVGLGLISKEVKRVSVAHGTHGMFGNLGLSFAPLITGLLNWIFNPSAAYIFLGILNLSGVIILLLFPIHESGESEREDIEENNKTISPFLILLLSMMMGGIVYRGATVITPALFELNTGALSNFVASFFHIKVSPNLMATILTSMIFLAGVIAQYAGGRLAEKYHPEYCYIVFHSITIPIAFLVSISSNIILVLMIGIYFFFLLGMQPSENTLVAKLVPRKLLSSSYGLKFILTFGVGAASVKAAGFISDNYGVANVFTAIGMMSVILVSTIALLIIKIRKTIS